MIVIANIKPNINMNINEIKRRSSTSLPTLHFPINLGLIAAVLRKEGFSLKIIDNYAVNLSCIQCLKIIASEKPKYLLLTGYLGEYSYKFLKKFSKDIKNCSPQTTIIMGGPMATTIPELIIAKTDVDIVVIGEGEEIIVDLLHALGKKRDLTNVNGICFKDTSGNIFFTKNRERIKNLDSIPRPAYELFPIEIILKYLNKTGRCWELCTSRGCYGRCSFCKRVFGQKITYMSPEKVVDEMRYIYNTYGIDRFNFVDDNFLLNEKHIEDFCNVLRKCGIRFSWRFQGRPDKINGELAKLMKSAGFFGVSLGLESGSPKILDEMHKNLDIERAEKNVRDVIKEGIIVHASFIVGMPSENEKTIEETISYIKRIGLQNLNIGILTPFPGTEVYAWAKKMGKITDDDAYCENLGPVYEYPYVNLTKYSNDKLLEFRDMVINSARQKQEKICTS